MYLENERSFVMDKRWLSVVSYLAGCLLVAFIYLLINWDKGYCYLYGGVTFTLISLLAIFVIYRYLKKQLPNKTNGIKTTIRKIRRNNNFVASSISYYVIPFLSFVSTGFENTVILVVLIIFFAFIHGKNRMFLFSPVLDILGYSVLDCEIKIKNDFVSAYVITNKFRDLYTSGENQCYRNKSDEGVFFVIPVKDEN